MHSVTAEAPIIVVVPDHENQFATVPIDVVYGLHQEYSLLRAECKVARFRRSRRDPAVKTWSDDRLIAYFAARLDELGAEMDRRQTAVGPAS